MARMNELIALARLGTLGAVEVAELDSYLQVNNLLAVIQSRTRRALTPSEE